MITDLLLYIPLLFAKGFIALLPNSQGLPEGIESAIGTFVGYAEGVSWIFPVEALFQALIIMMGIEAGILLWHGFNWILRKIPGVQ